MKSSADIRFCARVKFGMCILPISFDKQFVRDFLEKIKWDKQPPAPSLPEDASYKSSEKHQEALKRLNGGPLLP